MAKKSSSGRASTKRPTTGRKGAKKATLPRTVRGAARIVTRAHKGAFKELKKH